MIDLHAWIVGETICGDQEKYGQTPLKVISEREYTKHTFSYNKGICRISDSNICLEIEKQGCLEFV